MASAAQPQPKETTEDAENRFNHEIRAIRFIFST
jgi:hypothetical protein